MFDKFKMVASKMAALSYNGYIWITTPPRNGVFYVLMFNISNGIS